MSEIKLPPLPRPDAEFGTHSRKQIREYARYAIELALQERGGPVEMTECGLCHNMRTLDPAEQTASQKTKE